MAFKGQNLRLFINEDKCIAASTNCTFDVEAIVESTTTKDDEDGWERNECTGKKFSASVDALMLSAGNRGASFSLSPTRIPVEYQSGNIQIYPSNVSAYVGAGETITIETSEPVCIFFVHSSDHPVAICSPGKKVSYTNNTGYGLNVYVGGADSSRFPDNINATIKERDTATGETCDSILRKLKANGKFNIMFAVAGGSHNGEIQAAVMQGDVHCTKITMNADNGKVSTYSATFEGTGELYFISPMAAMAAMALDEPDTPMMLSAVGDVEEDVPSSDGESE